MPQHLQESMCCCHLANLIGILDITTRVFFFITSVYESNIWNSLCVWIKPVCLSFLNNWSHWSRYCSTCYKKWACHVDICWVYIRDSVFLQNQSIHQPISYCILLWKLSPIKCSLHVCDMLVGQHLSCVHWGCLCGLNGSMLDHRWLPPEFESQCGHIWMGVSSLTSLHYLKWKIITGIV